MRDRISTDGFCKYLIGPPTTGFYAIKMVIVGRDPFYKIKTHGD